MQSSAPPQEVNLAFQGGGAKGFAYVGCVQALNKRNLKPKNIAGSSAGALQAVLVALGVEEEEIKKVMVVGSDSKMGHIDDIQDFIKMSTRRKCFDKHYATLENYMKQEIRAKAGWFKTGLFNLFMWPQIESVLSTMGKTYSEKFFKAQGAIQTKIVPEMLINGELVYGQVLVQMVEGFLDKYLGKFGIEDSKKRKNITLAEFKEKVGVNLILTGSDLTDKQLRIFTATTTPKLPVKFACRISAGFPFFFPPIYWQKEWGQFYLKEKIVGNKMIDGGLLLNLPTPLLSSSECFRKKYITDDPIPPNSIIAFSFVQDQDEEEKKEGDGKKKQDVSFSREQLAELPDVPEPYFDDDYLQAVGCGQDFMLIEQPPEAKGKLEFDDLNVPGLQLVSEIVATMISAQQTITREIFPKRTVLIDVTGIETLNFPLKDVDVEGTIKVARDETEKILDDVFK